MKRSLVSVILSLSLIFSPLARASGVISKVDQFVAKYKNSVYAYTLSTEEFEKAISERGAGGSYGDQIRLTIEKTEGAKDSISRIQELEEVEKINFDAFQIVDEMFKQNSIEQMNLDLLSIMHDYIFETESRGPLTHIINAIEQYHFSPDQMHEMKKQATYLKQYTTGSMWAFAAVTVGVILSLRGRSTWVIEHFRKLSGKASTTTAKTTSAVKSSGNIVNEADSEIEQMLKEINKLRGGSALAHTTKSTPTVMSSSAKISKNRFFSKISEISKKQTFNNFAFIMGASAVGGSANIGLNALNRAFFNEDITRAYINPETLKSNIYDGLAVLNLSCRSYDLLEKTKQIEPDPEALNKNRAKSDLTGEEIEILKELNSLYAEYAILKKLIPQYLEKTYLPETVTANTEMGTVSLKLDVNGHQINETVNCEKLNDAEFSEDGRIEVNLGEALSLLSTTYLLLTGQTN